MYVRLQLTIVSSYPNACGDQQLASVGQQKGDCIKGGTAKTCPSFP